MDIHPQDPRAGRGDTFVIGVRCQREHTGHFEICLTATTPEEHHVLRPGEESKEITVRYNAYKHFQIPIDATRVGKVRIIYDKSIHS